MEKEKSLNGKGFRNVIEKFWRRVTILGMFTPMRKDKTYTLGDSTDRRVHDKRLNIRRNSINGVPLSIDFHYRNFYPPLVGEVNEGYRFVSLNSEVLREKVAETLSFETGNSFTEGYGVRSGEIY